MNHFSVFYQLLTRLPASPGRGVGWFVCQSPLHLHFLTTLMECDLIFYAYEYMYSVTPKLCTHFYENAIICQIQNLNLKHDSFLNLTTHYPPFNQQAMFATDPITCSLMRTLLDSIHRPSIHSLSITPDVSRHSLTDNARLFTDSQL